jgi:hypothetical protein
MEDGRDRGAAGVLDRNEMVCAGDSGEGGSSDNGEKANHDGDGENGRVVTVRKSGRMKTVGTANFRTGFILDAKPYDFRSFPDWEA